MERWQNRVAVVTGASSGIGAAIAKDLVKAGLVVVALARRKERLDELKSSLPANLQKNFHVIKTDISDEKSVNEAFDWIEKNLAGVDVLVNNAGVLKKGSLVSQDIKTLRSVLDTNVLGVISCTQRAFKSMKERNVDGHVIIVNSVVGHQVISLPPGVVPDTNLYPPSKYAITAITEILRQEFRELKTKIKVTSISPGVVDTDMVPEAFKSLPSLKAEDISSATLYAISTPPHVQIHEIIIKPVGEPF